MTVILLALVKYLTPATLEKLVLAKVRTSISIEIIDGHATEMSHRIDTRLIYWIEPSRDSQILLVLTDMP